MAPTPRITTRQTKLRRMAITGLVCMTVSYGGVLGFAVAGNLTGEEVSLGGEVAGSVVTLGASAAHRKERARIQTRKDQDRSL